MKKRRRHLDTVGVHWPYLLPYLHRILDPRYPSLGGCCTCADACAFDQFAFFHSAHTPRMTSPLGLSNLTATFGFRQSERKSEWRDG